MIKLPQVSFNSTYPKGGVSCTKDSFVVNQTLVFQIKVCGLNPALRVAANRYRQCKKTTSVNRMNDKNKIPTVHSGTFACPNARAKASQSK
jgi:hypothetical protein